MSAVVAHQARYELLSFWRRPQCRFLTLVVPVAFLVFLTAVFGDVTYYAGQLAAVGVISAAMASIVVSATVERENGILKRRRAAPVPATTLVAGRLTSAAIVAAATVAVIVLVAWVAYDVRLRLADLPALVLATAIGTVSFACLGYAVASFVRSARAAIPVVLGLLVPLYLISGVLVPADELPSRVLAVADAFPVRHLAQALCAPLEPATTGSGVEGLDLLVVAAWGLAGFVVAARHFSWDPRS